jgi:crotonobetainyl-CoA:carnitine CoA-transferase CaiB-like acyl-CoA transferase
MFEDEHFWARGMFVPHADPELGTFVGPGVTPSFSATPGAVRWPGGNPGSHNQAVFGELLGLSEAERRRLVEEGVI